MTWNTLVRRLHFPTPAQVKPAQWLSSVRSQPRAQLSWSCHVSGNSLGDKRGADPKWWHRRWQSRASPRGLDALPSPTDYEVQSWTHEIQRYSPTGNIAFPCPFCLFQPHTLEVYSFVSILVYGLYSQAELSQWNNAILFQKSFIWYPKYPMERT